jgi:hypothetical protein
MINGISDSIVRADHEVAINELEVECKCLVELSCVWFGSGGLFFQAIFVSRVGISYLSWILGEDGGAE